MSTPRGLMDLFPSGWTLEEVESVHKLTGLAPRSREYVNWMWEGKAPDWMIVVDPKDSE